jgi:hypothetical protein
VSEVVVDVVDACTRDFFSLIATTNIYDIKYIDGKTAGKYASHNSFKLKCNPTVNGSK